MAEVLNKRSDQVQASGIPTVPLASQMKYGELALNYASGAETMFIKNSNDNIVSFSNDNAIIGYVDNNLSNYYTKQQSGNAKIFSGTCSTAAGTVAKVVDCDQFTSEDLVKGALIFVTFSATNSGAVASLTMNVNDTGEKPLRKIYTASTPVNLTAAGELRANQTYLFSYDGTNWVCMTLDYNTNSTYSVISDSELQTGTATTGRTVSAARLKANYNIIGRTIKIGADTIDVPLNELSENYEMSSLESNITLEEGDTYEEAFGKLEKAILNNELVTSHALNNLDQNIQTLIQDKEQLEQELIDDELIIANALNNLNTNKQDKLESGINIKTINNQSLLDEGNLDLAPISSPQLTGIPTAPTAETETNTTQIATTKFVQNNLSKIKANVIQETLNLDGVFYDAQVEYLQSNGTQYIDLDIKPDPTEIITLKFQLIDSVEGIFFGCRKDASTQRVIISKSLGGNIATALGSHALTSLTPYDTNVHTVTLDLANGTANIDNGEYKDVGPFTVANFKMALFGCYTKSTASSYSGSLRVMRCTIGNRMDLIPVRKNGIGYMYDCITHKLFGSAIKSNEFTYGEDIYDSEVEYLQSDGSSYIDTGIKASSNITVDAEFEIIQNSYHTFEVFGSRVADNNKEFMLIYHNQSATGLQFRYNGSWKITSSMPLYGNYIIHSESPNVLTINDEYTLSCTASTFSSNYSIYLFTLNNAGTPDILNSNNIYLRIKWFKIYDDGVLVRDYIPVRNNNIGYLYDRVSKELFGNTNSTGAFVYGNDINYENNIGYESDDNTTSSNIKQVKVNENIYKIDADLLDGQHGDYYAPIDSPTFTGVPATSTPINSTNNTQLATTEFVHSLIKDYLDGKFTPIVFERFNKTISKYIIEEQTSPNNGNVESGNASINRIYGITFVWNQLFENSTSTVETMSGATYLLQRGSDRSTFVSEGENISAESDTDMLINLSHLYGPNFGISLTVEQFNKFFPKDYYPYSAPRLITMNVTKFVSVSNNSYNVVNISVNTLTGKLNGSGESEIIFPDGLTGNHNNYLDSIYKDTDGIWKASKQNVYIKNLDLTSGTWTTDGSGKYRNVTSLGNTIYDGGVGLVISCNNLMTASYNNIKNGTKGKGYIGVAGWNTSTRLIVPQTNTVTNVDIIYTINPPKIYVLDDQQIMEQTFHTSSIAKEYVLTKNPEIPITTPLRIDVNYPVIDYEVKRICVENWGGNFIEGEITPYEAAQVETVGNKFYNNQLIERFDEFKYFVGLTQSHSQNVSSYSAGTFYNCDKLIKLTIPAANLVSIPGFIRDAGALTEIDLSPITSPTFSMSTSFRDTVSLVKVIYPHNKQIVGNTYFTFRRSMSSGNSLTTIDFNGCDLSGIANMHSGMFNYCSRLTTLIGPVSGISLSLDISAAPLTRDSALVLINGLSQVSTTKTLTIKASSYNLLTEDDIAIATNKGWTIASA